MLRKIFSNKKKVELENVVIDHTNDVSAELIQKLYLSVGWKYRNIKDIQTSLERSVLVTSAWDNEMLIGIARATGDGLFNATIWDVAVHPHYQKQGIGALIIKSMLTKLDDHGIPLITLYTECAKKHFYSKFGFKPNSDRVIAMYRYKDD